jgi:hypothetical protein
VGAGHKEGSHRDWFHRDVRVEAEEARFAGHAEAGRVGFGESVGPGLEVAEEEARYGTLICALWTCC